MIVKRGNVNRCNSRTRLINKRGQITIFIIIGIILLFSFAGVMYFTQSITKDSLTAEATPVREEVPQAFKQIQSYTENCLHQVAKRGLLILGEQGGYIYPDIVGEYSISDPTDSDGINLEPTKVPFWHYNINPNENNEVKYSTLKPKLKYEDDPEMSVEAQLARFVKEQIDDCLDNYTSFKNQGYEIDFLEESTLQKKVTVKIGQQNINFWLDMEIGAKKGTAETEMKQFVHGIPLKLKHYYEVADEISQVQQNFSFLERQAVDLIGTFSGLDSTKLPPKDATAYTLIPPAYWSEVDVKEKFKTLLVSNVPLIRYLGSTNFYRHEYTYDPEESVIDFSNLYQKNYDNMILPLELGSDLIVNFDYFGWNTFFDLNDKNGIIEPNSYSANYYVLNFNSHYYFTNYDVSYPVLITITDEEAFNGEGYNFVFALEANIRNNNVVEDGYVQPAPVVPASKSMVCDRTKYNTELVKTIVVDSYTNEPLDLVTIGLSIPNQDDCVIGATDTHGELESKYPAVYGGVGSYIKEDYLTSFYPIDTYQYKKEPGIIGYAIAGMDTEVIEIHKIKNIGVKVKKKNINKCISGKCYGTGLLGSVDNEDPAISYKPEFLDKRHGWYFFDQASKLRPQEKAVVFLERVGEINDNTFGDEFVASVQVIGSETAEVELVPGFYSVNVIISNDEGLLIPKEERCSGLICFDMEETVMENYISAQVEWSLPEQYLTITPEQLYGADEITFYAFGFNVAGVPEKEHLRVIEDLQVMGELGNMSQIYRKQLEPRYD